MSNCSNGKCVFSKDARFSSLKSLNLKCQKCKKQSYCSERCLQQDWFKGHQFKCSGVQTVLSEEEALEIEWSTPFLKPGKILEDSELQKTNLSLSDFDFLEKKTVLGKGAYGEVKLVMFKKTKELYALKILKKSSSNNKNLNLMKEVEIHWKLKHENVVRLLHHFEDEGNLYLILEYAP